MLTNEQINLLNAIKQYIAEDEMSFLIGVGFSRNVNKEAYPLWGELLKEAAVRLFVNDKVSAKQKEGIRGTGTSIHAFMCLKNVCK